MCVCVCVCVCIGFERLSAKDYRLAYLPATVGGGAGGGGVNDGGVYFIVSPKDLVVARPRDFDDHISWLLDRRLFGQVYIYNIIHTYILYIYIEYMYR